MKRLISTLTLAGTAAAMISVGPHAAAAAAAPKRAFAVRVLPAFPGLPVRIGLQTGRTDAHGVAHFDSVPIGAKLVHQVRVPATDLTVAGRHLRVEQARVLDQGATVTLNVYYEVRFAFEKTGGVPFDAAHLDTFTVKSTTGAVETLHADRSAWLFGARVVPLAGGLQAKDVLWSVQAVPYKGSNLVHASQQRFDPTRQAHIDVSLLFFHARLHVYDAFFGFAQGTAVEFTFPDGSTQRFPVAADGTVKLASLPRATYKMRIIGSGPGMTRLVALSRNQDLSLKFYSWLDLGLAAGVVVLLAIGLLLVGRRLRRRHRRRPGMGEPRCLLETARVGPAQITLVTAMRSQRQSVGVAAADSETATVEACERAWRQFGGVFPIVVLFDPAADGGEPAAAHWQRYTDSRGISVEAAVEATKAALPDLIRDCFRTGIEADLDAAQRRAAARCAARDGDLLPGAAGARRIDVFTDIELPGLRPVEVVSSASGDAWRQDEPAVDTPPVDTPPVDTPPADTPPVDTPPADTVEREPATERTKPVGTHVAGRKPERTRPVRKTARKKTVRKKPVRKKATRKKATAKNSTAKNSTAKTHTVNPKAQNPARRDRSGQTVRSAEPVNPGRDASEPDPIAPREPTAPGPVPPAPPGTTTEAPVRRRPRPYPTAGVDRRPSPVATAARRAG